jgi:subtilisin family serine protease
MFTLLTIFFLQFANKAGSDVVCLSPTALEMRQERGIAIDSLDYAVSPVYLDSVKAMGAKVIHTSRWMNGATIEASYQFMDAIKQCSFVDTFYLTRLTNESFGIPSVSLRKREAVSEEAIDKPGSDQQINQLNLLPLHQLGFKGKGIRIGIADGGFYNANTLASLPHEQCLGYTDLTDDKDDIFGSTGNHGSLCLSAIVAHKEVSDGTSIGSFTYSGTATDAVYYLFKTEEHSTESPKEIDNWVAAIEMADSLGLHIVSTSLGYTTFDNEQFNFAYSDMDGLTSRGALASRIAARKGMLLVTAMGNEGNKNWHYLSTPADADSILSVGAVNKDRAIANFSSFGPAADGRVKPEVCAMGEGTSLINPATDAVMNGNGTSFACPLIAGMAASLWSALPQATNMEIRELIIRSCDRYQLPHEHYGYGIPDAWKAYTSATTDLPSTTRPTPYTKILHNGQLYILYNNQVYDILGNHIAPELLNY